MEHFAETPIRAGTGSFVGTLRDEVDEKQRIEKENIDLKLKLAQLEENLKRAAHQSTYRPQHSDLESEVSSLRLHLEEREIELEQRNLLLLKAKGAIEGLKSEIHRLKADGGKQILLEERVQQLKLSYDLMESELKGSISQLEQNLQGAREKGKERDHMVAMLEQKNTTLEVNLGVSNERLQESAIERDRLLSKVADYQSRIVGLQEELTQTIAQVDIHKQEVEEQTAETVMAKTTLREAQFAKQLIEEQLKSKLELALNSHEAELKALQQLHVQELESIRREQEQGIQQIKEGYQSELNKARAELESKLKEARANDSAEFIRTRNELTERLMERGEEVKVLRSLMENDHRNMDALVKDVDGLRVELRARSELVERLRAEAAAKDEELKLLRKSHELCVELKETLRKEEVEKVQLVAKLEHTTSALQTAREAIGKQQLGLNTTQLEQQIASRELQELRAAAGSIADVSRENERLKARLEVARGEQVDLNHKLQMSIRDVMDRESSLKDTEGKLRAALEECSTLQDMKSALEDHVSVLTQAANNANAATLAGESTMKELRRSLETTQRELEEEKRERRVAEKELNEARSALKDLRADTGRACINVLEALRGWDESLANVLDGDLFAHFQKPSSRAARGTGFRSPNLQDAKDRQGLMEADGVSLEGASIGQAVAVAVERFGIKVEGIRKIRVLFESQAERMAKSLCSKVDSAEERVSLCLLRCADASAKIEVARSIVDRDSRQKQQEGLEMRKFREEILNEHSQRTRDLELRLNSVSTDLHEAHKKSELLQKESDGYKIEVSRLQALTLQQQSDLEALSHAERVVNELSVRMSEISDINRQLTAELARAESACTEMQQNIRALGVEKQALAVCVDRYEIQLRARDESAQAYEARIEGLQKDIERLQHRQINPELERTIKQTQDMLLSETGSLGRGDNNVYSESYQSAGLNDTWREYQRTSSGQAAPISRVMDSVAESKPSVTMDSATVGDRRAEVHGTERNYDGHMATPNQLRSSIPPSHGAITTANMYFPSRQGVMNNVAKVDEFSSGSTFQLAHFQDTPVPHSDSRNAAVKDSSKGFIFQGTDSETPQHGLQHQTPQHDLQHQHFHASGTGSLQGRSPSQYGRSAAASPLQADRSITNNWRQSSRPQAQVPSQSSRLTKLGTDLQLLARKLDSFEANAATDYRK